MKRSILYSTSMYLYVYTVRRVRGITDKLL